MSVIGYREWEIWVNQSAYEKNKIYNGWFECVLLATNMTYQTIEFLAENYEIYIDGIRNIGRAPAEINSNINFERRRSFINKNLW